MVNRTHDSMTKAYDRVLTALTYIRGPMINDWVNTQENNLIARTDTTKPTMYVKMTRSSGPSLKRHSMTPGWTCPKNKTHMTNS